LHPELSTFHPHIAIIMATVESPQTIVVPSYNRVEPGSVNLPIADLSGVPTSDAVDVESAAGEWTNAFNKAIQSGNYSDLSDLFLQESYWRDQLGLAWDFHTLKGPKNIVAFLESSKNGCRIKSIAIDKSSPFRAPHVSGFDGAGKIKGVETFLTIETDVGSGMGVARLVQQGGKWKAFTLFTSMRELKGHEESVAGRRPQGVDHGGKPGRKNWLERRVADANFENSEPAVLILGKKALPAWRSIEKLAKTDLRCRSRRSHLGRSTEDARR
jgi:hypothetical protein